MMTYLFIYLFAPEQREEPSLPATIAGPRVHLRGSLLQGSDSR